MADRRELCVGGKPISSLRVVDLKVELEKRSLPKSGSKKDLLERLRLHLQLEEDREAALRDEEHVPNLSARFQVQREAKKQYEEKKRESEASAEETTQDEDEASDVSPTKKSPRKAMRPKKKEDSTSTPKAHKSSLDFQTPDSMPYSTPPQEKRDEDGARQESDTTGEEEECMTPQTRKHKLLKYVQQPSASKDSNPGKSDTGQFSIADHVEKYQGSGTSERRDPPPSSLYGEAINLKVESKKETSPVKSESSPVKKESSLVKKESSSVKTETPSPAKKDERALRGQKTRSVKAPPEEVSDEDEEEEEEEKGVFPRLVEVWSEKEREEEAAASAGKSVVQKSEKLTEDIKSMETKEDGIKPHVINVSSSEECKKESPTDTAPCETDPLEDTTTATTAQTVCVKDEAKPVKNESETETPAADVAVEKKNDQENSEEMIVDDSKADDAVDITKETKIEEAGKISEQAVVENKVEDTKTEELAIPTTVEVAETETVVQSEPAAIVVESASSPSIDESTSVPAIVDAASVPAIVESASVPAIVESASVPAIVESASVPTVVESASVPAVVESASISDVVESASTADIVEDADKTVLPVTMELPVADPVSVEKTSVPPETSVEDTPISELEPETKVTSANDPESVKNDETEVDKTDDVSKPKDSEKDNIDSSPDKVETTMAVENESPSLIKSDVCEEPVAKVEEVSEEQPTEDNEEDELQMDTTEIIDDSLKLTAPETEDVADNCEQRHRKSSSKSPSPRQSSPEREINRKRSLSPHDKKQQSDAAPQNETTKGDTVRKWKIRKQLPSAEADTAETEAPKKRRWGTSQLLPTKKPALVISTDSLKTLVPDAKPLSAEEVRLGSPNFQPPVKPTVNQTPESEDHQLPAADKIAKVENVRRVAVEMAVEAFAPAKPEAVMAAAAPLLEATSPAQQPRSSVLNVSNLVRPFTINQLKELLARTGHLVEGKFWIDRVKSSCLVQYATEDEAEETRAALHGIHWPTSNPKTLLVDYSTVEDLENRMSGKELTNPPVAKIEPIMRTATATVHPLETKRDKAEKVREWDLGKTGDQGFEKEQAIKGAHLIGEDEEVKPKDETPAKLLDDLFRKTKATPFIYWLPLTASQIAEKEEMRRQRLAERETRLKEVQQRRDEELQQRQREREKQRENERERQRAREKEREKERQRSRKRSRSSSRSSSSTTSSSPNKRRHSKTPPRKR
ncbi:apoptotic chromatin condensation inducer in the nucleus isoform X3 [Daphnia magna]|uniref:apoptotic chromatin condensation inducer in the nucleus isoform X3 n=1 Tax=Daphnia magna TaxID=35525 RepID=UPI001E1BB621|nr:apoptotic chromatin condensation inducer in the nucleus isoform X3 [Daphnia magna]